MALTVVIGPPAAGKTTWVRRHAKPGDIVIDFDQLAAVLSPHEPGERAEHDHTPAVATVARAARRAAIDTALRHADQVDVYLVHATPGQRVLAGYRKRGARIITVDPGKDVVLERCRRLRSKAMLAAAEQWYRQQQHTSPAQPALTPAARPAKGTTQRGYGSRHRQLREAVRPDVDAGLAVCWRCQHPIAPGTPWDLGHDDHDRNVYRGPEHRRCNRASAAVRGNTQRINTQSRNWFDM